MSSLARTSPLLLLASTAFAQTPLLREGDPDPSGRPGQTVSIVLNSATNKNGGYAFRYSTSGPAGTIGAVYGNLAGGAPMVLREAGMVGGLTQVGFEFFLGINATQVCYSAELRDPAGGSPTLDSIWIDDTLIVRDETLLPGSTTDFARNSSAPRITETGLPSYAATYQDSTFSSGSLGENLYLGSTRLLGTGDIPANFALPLDISCISDLYDISEDGSRYIVTVQLAAPSTEDEAVVVDGAGLVLGGSPLIEGVLMPTSLGGNGVENWDNFDFTGITEAGDYMITGDTDGTTTRDEFILRNGLPWAREGDMIAGETVSGSLRAAALSESNLLTYVWSVQDSSGFDKQALFLERNLIIKEGDNIDWDGDGSPDPGVTVVEFTGTNSIAIDSAGVVYFSADCDVNGTVLRGLFQVGDTAVGTPYCSATPNSSGAPGKLIAFGTAVAAANQLTLSASDLPTGQFGIFVVSDTQAFVPMPGATSNGNLCLGGTIGRYNRTGEILSTGATGSFSLVLDLTDIPQGNVTASATAGDTWNFQGWHRDSVGAGSNFTEGLEVLFL